MDGHKETANLAIFSSSSVYYIARPIIFSFDMARMYGRSSWRGRAIGETVFACLLGIRKKEQKKQNVRRKYPLVKFVLLLRSLSSSSN